MTTLTLKPTSAPIKAYYDTMRAKDQHGFTSEGNVSPAFGKLLEYCAKQMGYHLNEQHAFKTSTGRNLKFDGALLNTNRLRMGIWEAKDIHDDLPKEIRKKFEQGYPKENILFQSPTRAILYQNGKEVMSADLSKPAELIDIITLFLGYTTPAIEAWTEAIAEFKVRVPELAHQLDTTIEKQYRENKDYRDAFTAFHDLCRATINPNLSKDAVEEMLIQHLLTERIFRKVFNNDNFTTNNIIAREIELVINQLHKKAFSRAEFLRGLDHFYGAIEATASTISDYNEKQDFLNTVYEQFFQGFSVAVADTHGIVYTPQPIVQFMVRSVEQLLKTEFSRSLADDGVHILDPFVGTGNFMLRVMEEIRLTDPSALARKYKSELHCNEIMLLPYYIASMNIEHAFYEANGTYAPFEGICLVDTFELAEARQMGLFTQANLERVERQRKAPLTVILGNPPYNAKQSNENDNNKNRTYKVIDGRVAETYSKNSTATNKNSLSDPYIKAFRWASDRIGDEGVIAYVSNNSFLDGIAFDGMRKHLAGEFDAVYVLDLGGNSRQTKRGEKVSSVFDIRVGVCITFLIKRKQDSTQLQPRNTKIYYYRVPETGQKADKLALLDEAYRYDGITWRLIEPTKKYLWLTDGMEDDYETFLPLGTQEAKKGKGQAIFELFSNGIKTHRDDVVYGYRQDDLIERVQAMIEAYNGEVDRYKRANKPKDVDGFVNYTTVVWSAGLKNHLKGLNYIQFNANDVRESLYRPFSKRHLVFNPRIIERTYQFTHIFPTPATEAENRVINVGGYGRKAFAVMMSNCISDLNFYADPAQCFPLYVYDADGANRRDNISDWALGEYQRQYGDSTISKADIFYAVYALLHHPLYRERYAQNLKRELPRVPMVKESAKNPQPKTQNNPHPNPSPLHGEGLESDLENNAFSLPPQSGGRVGDGGDFMGAFEDLPHVPRPSLPLWANIIKPLARQMRHEPTPAEAHLWEYVRMNRLANKGFRRQHPIDRFIVDFYCHEARLVVEVDGDIHFYTQEEDAIRQEFLESLGLRVIRFSNDAVLNETARVLREIEEEVNNPHPLTPSPLHGEGEQGSDVGGNFSLPLRSGGRVGDGGAFEDGEQAGDGGAFHHLANLGRALADLHLNYESAPEYALIHSQNSAVPPSMTVETMRLNKDKTALVINNFLTLTGIPIRAYDYKLGNRSALEWVIDQYRVTTDKRSGISNDPNRLDDEGYIVRLVKQVVHVSLETLRLVDEIAKIEF